MDGRTLTKASNVVLVHGLYADASCWIDVIPYLQNAGLNVTAVQNPLTSLADAAAATRRVLALQKGPTVLVGHSFAGTIISETGNDPNVSALVYVAARAPDAGEDFAALAAKFPKPPASAGVVRVDGFFWLGEDAFLKNFFASDLAPTRHAHCLPFKARSPVRWSPRERLLRLGDQNQAGTRYRHWIARSTPISSDSWQSA
jgi:pimeloyl-ACP methyl ester carboxylesterase